MNNIKTSPADALYPRIVAWAPFKSPCCKDDYAICPDCEAEVCVFCEGECSNCETTVF